eukprot:TRINITY_DN3756_c0_g1_i1.p1 TRINITY_DN3756_c0_g1~~TRINITY_DN3756_c0_g1_i1.p1  ORF type:complete len:876 (-),score=225.18 TRINITY_DN3756_c0_g1_i1:799-3138(-)
MQDAKDNGNALIAQNEFARAIEAYSKAISIGVCLSPLPVKLLSTCYSNRSEAMLRMNRNAEAADDAVQALFYESGNVKAHFRLGMAHFKMHDLDNAVNAWQKGLTFADKPGKKEFQKWLAKCKEPEKNVLDDGKDNTSNAVTILLKTVEEAYGRNDYKTSIMLLEQILVLAPTNAESLLRLGEITFTQSQKLEKAATLFERGIAAHPNMHEFYIGLADVQLQLKNYQTALDNYRIALECLAQSPNAAERDATTVKIGDVFMASGDGDSAMKFYSSILARDQKHQKALAGYATVLFHRANTLEASDPTKAEELHQEALQVRLHVLVANPKDRPAREAVADCIAHRGGVSRILKQLSSIGAESGAALAFLASLIKDYSVLPECCELYEQALKAQPTSSSYALNLVHAYEARAMYRTAIVSWHKFLNANKTISAGGVSCEHVLHIVQTLNAAEWKEERPTSPDFNLQPGTPLPPPPPITAAKLTPYTAEELDLLALFFTGVKLLYVTGFLAFIPPLVALLEPCRERRDLHLTTIRNEQAYFSCIAKLLERHTLPYAPAAVAAAVPIYLIGDSHCLSASWKTLTYQGAPHVLCPFLVTGVKIWHLRSESRFYPKSNLFSVLDAVPRGATVISILGEIDCREGLLISVEKGRYADLHEAASFVVELYVDLLRRFIRERDWTVFVHPVAPVLNETRNVVRAFNAVLKQCVCDAAAEESLHGSLRWLDFFEELLEPAPASAPVPVGGNREVLRRQYDLDGTHLSSSYVALLQRAADDAVAMTPQPV